MSTIAHALVSALSMAFAMGWEILWPLDAYRIPVTLNGNKPNNVTVTMERPLEEAIRLFDLADELATLLFELF
jgi:hypothetical protein